METELKLLIDEAAMAKLEKLPLLESVTKGPSKTQQLVNVYFDTPKLELQQAGLGLRVRHVDDKRLQTLKADGRVNAGLHQREEWEAEIAGERPDLLALREILGTNSPYGKFFATAGLADRLQPIFTINVSRTIRQLRLRTGEEIEMAVDRGTIELDDAKEAISEIEFELKSGVPVHLFTFALELLDAVPMRIGTRSKAERGYAMRMPEGKKIVKAAKLQLKPSMTVEAAFEAVVSNCMEQIRGNEYGVTHGTDPESIHQMRVGLRRLRSAFDLFKGAIECPSVMQDEWKWLASQLGAARDWEVLADSTLEHLQGIVPPDVNVEALKDAAMAQARKNRDVAAQAVTSSRHTRLQLLFAEWMVGKGWRSSLPESNASFVDLPLKKFAKQVLKHGEERLLKRGKHLKDNDPASRHRVRIAGKKARYATEFFQSLYPKGRVKGYVSNLSQLQEELGWLNDAAVAVELLNQLQLSNQQVASSAAFARGFMFSSIHGDNANLTHLWTRFAKADPPYRH